MNSENDYWLGVKDVGASEDNAAARIWQSHNRMLNKGGLYLETLRNYHEFKIQNLGSLINGEERLMYTDRFGLKYVLGENICAKFLLIIFLAERTSNCNITFVSLLTDV